MSTPARFLGVTAIAVLVVGWSWWRYDGSSMREPAAMRANEPTLVTTVVTPIVGPVPVNPTVATEDSVAILRPSPLVSSGADDGIEALVRKMTDRAQKNFGPQLVAHLVSKGLSPADSERAVAEIMPDWVRCQVDATLAQADEQSLSRGDALS